MKRCNLTHELAGNTPWPTAWHLRWMESADVAGRAIRTCSHCGERLALGPARDDGPHAASVAIEIRAAEIATEMPIADAWLRGVVSDCERDGWELWANPDAEPTCTPEEVGYLARCIATHLKESCLSECVMTSAFTSEHAWLLEQLVDRLLDWHPLPWHIDHDWTVEVLTKKNDVVMKCMTTSHAEALIALAEQIAKGNETGQAEVESWIDATDEVDRAVDEWRAGCV